MREDEVKKAGIRMTDKRLKETVTRQILTTKVVENVPSTIFANEDYIDPLIQ